MPIGEAFLSASLQVLFDKLASPLISELGKLQGVKYEIARLKRTLKRLKAMLHDAEQKVVEGEHFTLWLRELQTAAHAAEDVVDEFEYEALRRELNCRREGRHGVSGNYPIFSTSGRLCKLCSCLNPQTVSFRYKIAHQIDGIRRKLDEIAKEKRDLDVNVGFPREIQQSIETTALSADPQVLGREEVKNKLVKLLLRTAADVGYTSSSSLMSVHPSNFSVISIVGMPGLGKTILAQLVYHTKQVQDHFDTRIWVCVSLDFDLKRLTKHILEHLVDPQSSIPSRDNLNVLQQDLSEKLKGKRFLLILDDVWEEDENKWKAFSDLLTQGVKGSKVLITTRNANVANKLQPEKIELEVLPFDDCWSIFKKHAFTATNSRNYQILEPIGREIVKRLNGVPLAVATIGGLLGSESDDIKWRDVLNNNLWELKQGGDRIFPALKLSYEYLPFHLKQCFTYCCVFPKSASFDMLTLVQLWVAQDFVRPQRNRSKEDVGKDCLKELLNRSLIQIVNGRYVIHDLLHDLGQSMLEHEYCRIGLVQVMKIPEDARSKIHLIVDDPKPPHETKMEVLYEFKSLRTLSFWFTGLPHIKVPIDLFYAVKCLRVLDLSYTSLGMLPNSIGCLKHLRYIDLRETDMEWLPDSFCALYNLQTLKLEGCDKLNTLPKGMNNLVNLHYLEAKSEVVSKIAEIGRLRHLQYLEVFSISDENKNRIGDLKNMKELRGALCIQNLERVMTREEAAEASLKNMQYLESLELQWGDGQRITQERNDLADSIIEGLQPPQSLKKLTIKYYPGISFPSWSNINVSIPSFESQLPILRSLRTLNITGCWHLKELSHLPSALENLILQEVGLVVLPSILHHLPLQQLVLRLALDLHELPLLPFTLRELAIEAVGLQSLPKFCRGCEISSAPSGSDTDAYKSSDCTEPALSILKIHACPHLTTLDDGMLKHHLKHLKVLSIKDCWYLEDWPEGGGFQSTFCSLDEELSIEWCPKLKGLPEGTKLHPSLKKLVVKGCPWVPDELMFSQVHNFDDVSVEKRYLNLEHSANEALRHILTVDLLAIVYLQEEEEDDDDVDDLGAPSGDQIESPVFVKCEMESCWDWGRMDSYMARHVQLHILGRRRGGGRRRRVAADGGSVVSTDDGQEEHDSLSTLMLWRCLGGHPWTSSLRHLVLADIPGRAFSGVHHPLPPLPSLQQLWFNGCWEMRRLPTGMLLSQLTALKDLKIVDCPELTFASVDAGIRSVPSLESLVILRCPKLAMPAPQPSSPYVIPDNSDQEDRSSPPPPPAAPPPPPLFPRLRHLHVDDIRLLTRWVLVDHNPVFTSLRYFALSQSELTCLTAEEEGVLSTLAASFRCLAFYDCPNLEKLPADLRGLLPNLKVLIIHDCPKFRCLPAGRGLPTPLEMLSIKRCPELSRRGMHKGDDRHKVADLLRIPVFIIDGVYIAGSYSKYLELKANWDFRP